MAGSNSTLVAGRYEIRGTLVERGPYITYNVRDSVLGREAALRTFRDVPDAAAIERFARECDILTFINHPSVIDVFDRGEFQDGSGKKPFLIIAQVTGLTLDNLIAAESRRLTPVRVAEFMALVCRGFQAARDVEISDIGVELSDILLMKDDSVKIIRFSGGVRSTPPEDVFRLASICCQALTCRKVDGTTPQRLRTLNPEISEALASVVQRAMDSDPAKRFDTVRELGESLLGAVHGSSAGLPNINAASLPSMNKVAANEPAPAKPKAPPVSKEAEGDFTRRFRAVEVTIPLRTAEPAPKADGSSPGAYTRAFETHSDELPKAKKPQSAPITPDAKPSQHPPDNKAGRGSANAETRLFENNPVRGSNPEPQSVPKPFISNERKEPEVSSGQSEYSRIIKQPSSHSASNNTDAFNPSRDLSATPDDGEYVRVANFKRASPPAPAASQSAPRVTRSQQKVILIVVIAALAIVALMLILWAVSSR